MAAPHPTGSDSRSTTPGSCAVLRFERDIVDLRADVAEAGRLVAACHGIDPPPVALLPREPAESLRALESALTEALCGRAVRPRPGLIAAQLRQVFLYREGRLASLVPGVLSTIDARSARGRQPEVKSDLPDEFVAAVLERFGVAGAGGWRTPDPRQERAAA